jgi:Contractile injection system tape measure protein
VNSPIPVELSFHEAEWKEADLLLESVIEHWKVLKNTSVNGLRETFFKRDGLIMKNDVGWLLKVERKTLDVLLDNIPWGFSTLHLQWMPEVLHVEW